MENNNITLDEIIKKEGTADNNYIIQDTNTIIDNIDKKIESKKPQYAYGDIGPMPGQEIEMSIPDTLIDKEKAKDDLIKKAALFKLKKENEKFNKLADALKIKQVVLAQLFKQLENAYFDKYHYVMSGPLKRKVKKIIERDYDKGRYKLTPELKEDILYQLNLSSNTKSDKLINSNDNTISAGLTVLKLVNGI